MVINGINTDLKSFILKTINGAITDNDPTPAQDSLLLENSFYLLLEDGGKILIKT